MTLKLLLSLLFLKLSLSTIPCFGSEDEVRSLLEFKKGIKTDPLNKITSTWTTLGTTDPNGTVPCPASFHGVTCDPTTNSVSSLVLDHLGLSGDLKFNTLTGLKQLKNLSLAGNEFTGRLVPALGGITSLQYLDLSSNLFYGPIPARINELWSLNHLNFSNNNFDGGFPQGIRNLQQLKVLDLHSNHIYGDINELFSELRNIEHIDLSENEFYGSIQFTVQNVSALSNTVQYINLSRNKLGGGFLSSDSIALFRNLRVLDLGSNGITGELPPFMNLPNLRIVKLGNNSLFGSVPFEFLQGFVPLEELDLSGNGFSGSIPEINSTSLKTMNLSANVLSGSLPGSLGNCVIIDLSKNNLTDEISAIQNWGANMEIIDVSSNKLTGTLPIFTQFHQLRYLGFHNNDIEGKVPSQLGSLPSLITLDLSSNKLDGTIPSTLFTSTTLTNLNFSRNKFTGSIPLDGPGSSVLLVLPSYPPIESLDFSSNFLTGELSSNIGNFGGIKTLNLANNRFSGELPEELNKLTVLEFLDLSNNVFTGDIPLKLSSNLKFFNVSENDLTGNIPENLRNFPVSSFRPGNELLKGGPAREGPGSRPEPESHDKSSHHSSTSSVRIAIIVACAGAAIMVIFVFLAYNRSQIKDFRNHGFKTQQTVVKDVKLGRVNNNNRASSLSFSNDHLLTSETHEGSGSGSGPGTGPETSSPIASSPRYLDVNSPDRLAGELILLDSSLNFTATELSRAPAEVLGRSSHGTLYKATLDNGIMITVKWLRVGLVKPKKEFTKEIKKIGFIKNPNLVSLRAFYWGPREQERLILSDFVPGDTLALHLYETTPRRYSLLSFTQRFKIGVDIAKCLGYLHERGMAHGNLKPTNVILTGPTYEVHLTDYGLHRLLTPPGIVEQILNLGALGYRAPELTGEKPVPSFKADVYSFGVILMELLTRRSAGDIISGQSGAVDLTDWVRLCDQEGRGMDCIDRDITGTDEQYSKAMDEMLGVSLRCILPVNERPNIRQVFEELHSISV